MKKCSTLSAISAIDIFFILLILPTSCKDNNKIAGDQPLIYPETFKIDVVNEYFGIKVPDPYFWFEDDFSTRTSEWIEQQNKVTHDYISTIPFRNKIRERLIKLWDFEKEWEPVIKGEKFFYFKNDGLQNQSILYSKNSIDGKETELLNPNLFSKDGSLILSSISPSDDGKYVGYTMSVPGSNWHEIRIKDTDENHDLDDIIKGVRLSDISWYKDGFFYCGFPASENSMLNTINNGIIYYHKLGTPQENDIMIFEDNENTGLGFYADVLNSKKYLFISSSKTSDGNAISLKRLNNRDTALIKIIDDFDNIHCLIDEIDDYLYLYTNYEAPNYKVVKVDIKNPAKDKWVDFIPESEGVLESASFVGDRFIVNYMKDAHSIIKIFDRKGNYISDLDKDLIGTISGFNGERNDSITFYTVTSFTTPSTIYKYNIKNNVSTLYSMPKIDVNPNEYVTKQIFYESGDGTKVPMFIVHKEGISMDGNNPTLLYAYGGFGIPCTPYFDISRFILLEQGGILAVANVRGGGEYGQKWHEAGIKMNKHNTFNDFIAAAEYLITEKYTSKERLAIEGASNGGLVVGAVTNLRPDLCSVVVPVVGIMDMLRYDKFAVGKYWASDFGTSSDSEEMFRYLYGYSPVHNIKPDVEYPAVLVKTSAHDDRVAPSHSFKYISTLQDTYKGKNPTIIRIETETGYGQRKPIKIYIEETSDCYSFILYNLGFTPKYDS